MPKETTLSSPPIVDTEAPTDLPRAFVRSLEASNKSPRAVEAYREAVRLSVAYLPANNSYHGSQAFFKWAIEEGEVKESPMVRMKPPGVPEEPPDALAEDQLRKLFKECEGTDLEARRDMALIRVLVDTGIRRHELAGMTLEDLQRQWHCSRE